MKMGIRHELQSRHGKAAVFSGNFMQNDNFVKLEGRLDKNTGYPRVDEVDESEQRVGLYSRMVRQACAYPCYEIRFGEPQEGSIGIPPVLYSLPVFPEPDWEGPEGQLP